MSPSEEKKMKRAAIFNHDLPGTLMQHILQEMDKLVNWSEQDPDERVQVD